MVVARPVQGKHRTIKNRINVVLLILFLVLPFLRFGGNPFVLLDIPGRKFHVFGLEIWPHEFYFLHLILIMSGLSLFFFTALLGRIWCGYGCPQTIFMDFYDWGAKLLVGSDYGKRPLNTSQKIRQYLAFFILAIFFSFIFLAYFVPYEEIASDLMHARFFAGPDTLAPAAWVVFMVMSVGFAVFNAGYFRENACKLVCPYGRFQTALLDTHSPIVSYDVKRDEPRREGKQKLFEHGGDCIDCNMCNLVCPTGIDIREGLQVGCIACGLCVDACTNVLSKFEKRTLIDYRTIEQVENPDAHRKYLRPRTVVYASLLLCFATAFVYLLVTRIPMYATVLRDRAISALYVPDIGYQNGYEVHVGNQSRKPIEVKIMVLDKRYEILAPQDTYKIGAEGFEKIRFVVRSAQKEEFARTRPIEFKIVDVNEPTHERVVQTVFSYPI
jgi:cytochrome c oxidase accessory protein FixG